MPRRAKQRNFSPVKAAAQEPWDTISTDELADWQKAGPPTPLLDTVNFPVHIKNFNQRQLQQLCKELRAGKNASSPSCCSVGQSPHVLNACLPACRAHPHCG